MPKTLYLVASVPTQGRAPSPAQDLYTSHWFSTAKTYVATFSKEGDTWVVLSAKHGVLDPTQQVKPYDEKHISRSRQKRQLWTKGLVADLMRRTDEGDTIVMLAGPRQRENLVAPLIEAGREVQIPMADLRISQQKAWMRKKLEEAGVVQVDEPDDEESPGEDDADQPRTSSMLHSSALMTEASRVGGGSPKPDKAHKA